MIYALTQHSLFNRKYSTFLLHKCKGGEVVRNGGKVCKLLTHEEYVALNNKLSRK